MIKISPKISDKEINIFIDKFLSKKARRIFRRLLKILGERCISKAKKLSINSFLNKI